jgi:hypothetical protein
LLAAGDDEVVRSVLKRLAAMRSYMRARTIDQHTDVAVAASVGMEPAEIEDMYRLLALAKYDERFVIPSAHMEIAGALSEQQGSCGLEFASGPGGCGPSAPAEHADELAPQVEAFHLAEPAPSEGLLPSITQLESAGAGHGTPNAHDGCGGDGGCGCADERTEPSSEVAP